MADQPPVLDTARLRLEPVGRHHAADLQRHFADWAVIQHLTTAVPWPYPDDGVLRFLEDDLEPRIIAGRAMAWALVSKHADEAIGLLEWRCEPDTQDHRGFWLGRAFHGRGLMTEAITAFQDWVFFDRGLDRLLVANAVSNVASRRIKQKTGAVLLGHIEIAHHGGDTTAEHWEVTREAWATLRGH